MAGHGGTRYDLNFTGCGSMLIVQSPQVLQLIMDSLPVRGARDARRRRLRFDLASTSARECVPA